MTRLERLVFTIIAAIVVITISTGVYAQPYVTVISPRSGPTTGNTIVTITGGGLVQMGQPPNVTFGGRTCSIRSITNDRVSCASPAGVGANLPIRVIVGSTTIPFPLTYSYDAPTISSVSPNSGLETGNYVVTISGQNFGPPNTPSVSVTIGGQSCPILSQDQTTIRCSVPLSNALGAVPLVVTVAGQSNTWTPMTFTYTAVPHTISSISPLNGPTIGATALTIRGTNLGRSGVVAIGGRSCSVSAWTPSEVRVITPPGIGTNQAIRFQRTGGTAFDIGLFNYDRPQITSITPPGGALSGGTRIRINGVNFDQNSANTSVTIGGNLCPIVTETHGHIDCVTPAGSITTAPVIVTVGGQSSEPSVFTYVAEPQINALSPTSGPSSGEVPITLIGTNFGNTGVVFVGTTIASVTLWTSSEIRFTLPPGSGTLPVYVSVNGVVSNSVLFSYYSNPRIDMVSPSNGPTQGGTEITITGSDFGNNGLVSIGSGSCTVIQWQPNSIVCVTPEGDGRDLPVVVSVNGQQSNTRSYSYDSPRITALSIDHGPVEGGNELEVQGSNFGVSPAVLVGGQTCNVISNSHTSIRCIVPSGAGPVSVVVRTRTNVYSNSYLYFYDDCYNDPNCYQPSICTDAGVPPSDASQDSSAESGVPRSPDVIFFRDVSQDTTEEYNETGTEDSTTDIVETDAHTTEDASTTDATDQHHNPTICCSASRGHTQGKTHVLIFVAFLAISVGYNRRKERKHP